MLDLKTLGVVQIARDLYPLTEEALNSLSGELREIGYSIKNCREDEYRKDRGVTVEQTEREGWYLWYASLKNIRFGKCDFCNAYISTVGIRCHGRRCEYCGEVIYRLIVDGSTVTFKFLDQKRHGSSGRSSGTPELKMKAHRWDTDEGYLYLYPGFLEGNWSVVTGEQAQAYFDENADKWELTNGRFIKIEDSLEFDRGTAVIEHYDIRKHEFGARTIKIWEGQEYKEHERLPIPESMCIYEPWHWSPLSPSPKLHERLISAVHMVSDQGYYYQDGRSVFSRYHFDEMAKFVFHFTTLSVAKFRQTRFRFDGPGAIEDIARFCCGEEAQITNAPNIGNVLTVLGKAIEGKPTTEAERDAAIHGLADPMTGEFLDSLRQRRR